VTLVQQVYSFQNIDEENQILTTSNLTMVVKKKKKTTGNHSKLKVVILNSGD